MALEFRARLPYPKDIKEQYPLSSEVIEKKNKRDSEIKQVFTGESNKFILVIGPCSADNEEAVMDYIHRLKVLQEKVDDKVLIICPIHGGFWQTPYVHTAVGCGCPNCKNSKLENTIYEMLTEANIKFEYRKRSLEWLESLELDFYIPELKIAIECQGLQHFQPVDFSGKGEEWAKQQLQLLNASGSSAPATNT